jgi:2-C-methyl-D-erythritol 4-phosphate cytidylyltransferase
MMSNKLAHIALIVAGGSGSRMLSDIPKQFMILGDKPVLMHTLLAFSSCDEIYLVLPQQQIDTWTRLCIEYNFTLPHHILSGGNTRYQSVKNGLDAMHHLQDAIISIHDGVRPLVSQSIIDNCYIQAIEHGNAIAAVKPKDSIRMQQGDSSISVNRDLIYQIQTPQSFKLQIILAAYHNVQYNDKLTDDASVAEANGHTIYLCEGSYSNIKITTPEDMLLAKALLG